MRTRFLRFSVLALALTASPVFAWIDFELDMDGTVGNAPDTVYAEFADTVEVDLWWTGTEALILWSARVCEPESLLTYTNALYYLPEGWVGVPPQFPSPGCVLLGSYHPELDPGPLPFRVARLQYVAGVQTGISSFVVEADYLLWYLEDGILTDLHAGTVVIGGATSTEPTTWGSVKRLFR